MLTHPHTPYIFPQPNRAKSNTYASTDHRRAYLERWTVFQKLEFSILLKTHHGSERKILVVYMNQLLLVSLRVSYFKALPVLMNIHFIFD